MCTIRCLGLGVRLLRSEFGSIPVLSRPSYCSLAYFKNTANNYGIYRPSTSTKGHLLTQSVCTPRDVTYSRCRTCTVGTADYSTQPVQGEDEEPAKLSLFQRYKKMLKEYWYVLIPVHCVTSVIWFGCFYYAATCGVDIVPLLEYLGVSETLIKPLRSSSLGYLAVASAFYKLATPARYTVTLGGSTLAIRILTKKGLIKPIPSKEKMKEIVKKKKEDFIQRKTSQQ